MSAEMTNFEQLNELTETKQFAKLKQQLIDMNEVDIAAFIEQLSAEKSLVVFRLLPKDLASDVFSCLPTETQKSIIDSINDMELHEIIEDLYVDDAVDMVEELPASVVRRILKNATPTTRNLINQFLNYPENSAGSIMTAEYVSLKKNMTVSQALNYIRNNAIDKETIYNCYVTNAKRELEGVITLKDIVVSDPEAVIEDLMDKNVITAVTTEDREDVASMLGKYDLLALPVVDNENRLVGIVTVDDAVDVIEEETTEDIQKMAAMLPSEKPYLKTSVFTLAKNRIFWLLILMISAMFTGGVLAKYENAFSAVPLLVSFIPMLMDTGGNAGNQSNAMVIRGMVIGEIAPKDILKVLWKEFRVALICGLILAVVNFIRLSIQYPGKTMICIVIVTSVFLTVVLAKTIGCILPIVAETLHLDPAIMASPIITTIVDACSLIIYFQLACALLPQISKLG